MASPNQILSVEWYNGGAGCIGIVTVRNSKGIRSYIGCAKGLEYGYSEQEDIDYILDWGAFVPTHHINRLAQLHGDNSQQLAQINKNDA